MRYASLAGTGSSGLCSFRVFPASWPLRRTRSLTDWNFWFRGSACFIFYLRGLKKKLVFDYMDWINKCTAADFEACILFSMYGTYLWENLHWFTPPKNLPLSRMNTTKTRQNEQFLWKKYDFFVSRKAINHCWNQDASKRIWKGRDCAMWHPWGERVHYNGGLVWPGWQGGCVGIQHLSCWGDQNANAAGLSFGLVQQKSLHTSARQLCLIRKC